MLFNPKMTWTKPGSAVLCPAVQYAVREASVMLTLHKFTGPAPQTMRVVTCPEFEESNFCNCRNLGTCWH